MKLKKNLVVFLVDDDEDDRELFALALNESGISHELTTFMDGNSLLDFLQNPDSTPPDVLFLDLNMPLLDGISTLVALRKIEKCSQVKVVIYTTSGSPLDQENTFNAGASLYLQKPRTFSVLQKIVTDILNANENIHIAPKTKADFIYT